LRMVAISQESWAIVYQLTNGEVRVALTDNRGADWTVSLVTGDTETWHGAGHVHTVDVAYDRTREEIVVAYAKDDGFYVSWAGFTPSLPPLQPAIDPADRQPVQFFEPGQHWFGVNLVDVADDSGMSLPMVQWMVALLFLVAIVGGIFLVTRNAPLSFGGAGGFALIFLTVTGIIPVWVLLLLILFSAVVLILWFRMGMGHGGGSE
jgi:hypothetical protein